MDDLVTKVPPVSNPNVHRIEPESSERNPDRRRSRRKRGEREEEERPEGEQPVTSGDRKMDILV